MKIRRLMIFIVSAIVLAILVCVASTAYWKSKQPIFKDAPKLIAAMHAFARDLKAQQKPLPETVSLRELVSGAYIAGSDVKAFDGMEVTISLTADESHPSMILMLVRQQDGSVNVVMRDGSVQQFSAKAFEELHKQADQPGGPANGGQPLRSGTNEASSASGSLNDGAKKNEQ